MSISADAFNFDTMKEQLGVDPFAEKANKYARDERFYTLAKDKDGNGVAIIRFLPDRNRGIIQEMFKINTTITKNGKKRFVSEFQPTTIGLPCPFHEEWQRLWNLGDKEEAKTYSRAIRYVTNIKVLRDPANPENEGKIFLYEMSGAMKDKIQAALNPSEQDKALGVQPKELYNPLKGNSFKLTAKKGANGQINYDNSEIVSDVTSIYNTVEEALEDINNNTYILSDLLKPESFMSYDELKKKLEWVNFREAGSVVVDDQSSGLNTEPAEKTKSEPEINPSSGSVAAQQIQKTEQSSQSLDDLLGSLT